MRTVLVNEFHTGFMCHASLWPYFRSTMWYTFTSKLILSGTWLENNKLLILEQPVIGYLINLHFHVACEPGTLGLIEIPTTVHFVYFLILKCLLFSGIFSGIIANGSFRMRSQRESTIIAFPSMGYFTSPSVNTCQMVLDCVFFIW